MDWPEFFLSAIGGIAHRLPLAVQGNGARENWLQTEIMLYPMEDVGSKKYPGTNIRINHTSCYELNGRAKYDLASYRDESSESLDMVAEIKLLGGGYYNKNLKSAAFINKIISFNGDRYLPAEKDYEDNISGNILSDARRLKFVPKNIDAYLILILLKDNESENLYKALDKITFTSNPERESVKDFSVLKDCEQYKSAHPFKVKIWSIER